VAKLGLERSLDSLLSRTQESTGVVCSLTIKESLTDLNLQTASQVLRIMQECITNTIKHANATALKISIKYEGTNLMIQYRDNGIGIIENKPVDSGIGLQTIRERCESIGGELLFEAKKGKGFIVELIIPMQS
jgi:two-component system NarL family sensor kinase